MRKYVWIVCFIVSVCFIGCTQVKASDHAQNHVLALKQSHLERLSMEGLPPRFVFHSDLSFNHPKAVRGLYATAYSASGERMDDLVKMIDQTNLNSIVIDVKDDAGHLTLRVPKDSPLHPYSQSIIQEPKKLLKMLEAHNIYPIARVVVFKDSVLAKEHPEYTFKTKNGKVWTNGKGEAFVNPFLKDVWKYNVSVAKKAAELGFQDIQFDYVRFPEGFEHRFKKLQYNQGKYEKLKMDDVDKRVKAVTDFVAYAEEKMKRFDVDLSVDIFGYTATLPEAPGIGQNFTKISRHVDTISAMIYPSHWTSYFGIRYPDKHPYHLASAYAKQEQVKLNKLKQPPTSRPWIQDFTASWLPESQHIQYGKQEVEAQIRALNDQGIHEFLLWDANNTYTTNVDYTPSS